MRPAGRSFLAALLGAAAALADADWTIDVSCSSNAATLTLEETTASYICANNGGSGSKPMDTDYFMVNVVVDTLNLTLKSSSVVSLNFSAASGTPTLAYSGSTLDFVTFSNLTRLVFLNMKFNPESVELALQNTTTDIQFLNSTLSDLSLTNKDEALTQIAMDGTNLTTLPKFLYERKLGNQIGISVDLSSVTGEATLTKEQFSNLQANVEDLSTQSWAQDYNSSCTSSQSSGMTVSEQGSTTVSCGTESSASSTVTSSRTGAFTSPTGSSPVAHSNHSSSGSTGTEAGDSSNGISTGALVAIIVVVVVIALVLVFFILRTYFRRKAADANSHNNEATATLMSKSDAAVDKGSFISNDEFLRNFRLPQSDVSLVKSVGTGRLWVGEYNGGKVIVKRVESEVTDSFVTKALMAQARTFATISHPNITNLVGVTWLAGTDFAVVTEFMDKGNLKTVLSNSDVDLDVKTKLQMCCDVALALAYLHETAQNLCAKQLSSRKVLVNKAMNCKLSLFECVPSSTKLGGPSTAATYSYGMGEVAWLAPEVITRSSPMDARKNNIYAFGVLVSEIFTRVSPYQTLVEEQGNTMSDVELVKRVRRQEPMVPHESRQEYLEAPASVRQLVEQCLSYAPMSRPTAEDLVEVLHNAKEELATNSM